MSESIAAAAAGSDFDLDNLPLGIFSPPAGAPRPGVAIGDAVVDLDALCAAGLLDEPALQGARVLNAFLGAGRTRWSALRERLRALLNSDLGAAEHARIAAAVVPRSAVTMHLPIDVGDYVDFFSSIEHATNAGALFRPDNPLGPNYRHVPIGYHGRTSTIVIDGTPIARPAGQAREPGHTEPVFGPSRRLDFELELGFIAGPGSVHGVPIPIADVRDHVYGCVLLNDWSARDIQAWESTPLGPLLGKSFATSISPWVVSLDALEPFRTANRPQDPEPLAHLRTDEAWAFDIQLEVAIESRQMRAAGVAPHTIVRTNFRGMYWNLAQQLAHLTSNGSCIRPGDLFGSGTVSSGSEPDSVGSLLERTRNGAVPFTLPGGESRTFLADGDTVILRGRAVSGTHRIGLGEVRGTIAG